MKDPEEVLRGVCERLVGERQKEENQLSEKLVEIVVRADPEPDDCVTFPFRKSAEGVVDADGPNAILPS